MRFWKQTGRRRNAVGVNLDALAILVGVSRRAATASQATVTAVGTPATVIPAGSKVRGGGPDDAAIWTVAAPGGTIGGGGTVSLTVVADVLGETVAAIGTINEIVTPVSGWASVSNPTAATPGVARETNAELRVRRQNSLAVPGSRTMAGQRSALLEIDGVLNAVVVDNPGDVAATIGGVLLAAHSFEAIVYPSTLTVAQKQAVVQAIYTANAAGIQTNGAESGTVLGLDGTTRTIFYAFPADITIDAAIDVTTEPGYVLGDVTPAIEEAFAEYIEAIAAIPGGGGVRVSRLDIVALVAAIEGVQQVNFGTFTLTRTPPGGATPTDLLLDLDEHAVAGTISVT